MSKNSDNKINKYDVGDTIFVLMNNKVLETTITKVIILKFKDSTTGEIITKVVYDDRDMTNIKFYTTDCRFEDESLLFATKEELLASL